MKSILFALSLLAAASVLAQTPNRLAQDQNRPDPAANLAAQREAMKAFSAMDGAWRGTAVTTLPSGEKRTITQTERIGPFLDGSVKVIEGRGYDEADKVVFNAFGVISYDPARKTYSLRSHAMGMSGDFAFKPTRDGYDWEIPAGSMTIRYSATIRDGTLREVGDRVLPDGRVIRFFEMNLKRVGDTDWPAANPVSPR
jgi:hypothetical protein